MNKYRREATDTVLDERVTSLLAAAAAPTEPGPLPGEAEALAAFRASPNRSRRSPMHSSLVTVKTALAASLSAGVLVTGGVGAAMAGALPDSAQDKASEVLAEVGVTVPNAAEAAGRDDEASEEAGESSDNGKGSEVNELARTTEATGVDKGAEISDFASDGKSQAGEHGQAGAEHGQSGAEHGTSGSDDADESDDQPAEPAEPAEGATDKANAETPDNDGTQTAEGAPEEKSDDAAEDGSDKAEEATSKHGDAGGQDRP